MWPRSAAPPRPAHEAPPTPPCAVAPCRDADFKGCSAAKLRFIVPMTIFFLVYYFALPVLVGWFPDLMKTKVGSVNIAYLFALSQFFMAWIVAAIYVVKAARLG